MGMFANAKIIEGKTAKGKKVEEPKVLVPQLHLFAALKSVLKNVEAQVAVVEADIKTEMMSRFVSEGMRISARPANYKGEEKGSTASMQLRTRVSTSALSAEEIALLDEHNISYSESVARDETFIINPAYAFDMDMLSKVEEALSGLGLPADFIMKQEKVSKTIATETSIDEVCKLKDADAVAALLPLVTTPSIRPKLAEDANPFQIVEDALGSPEVEEVEESAEAA